MHDPLEPLLTLREGAAITRQSPPEAFSRFCRRRGIPLVRFSQKMVRVRREDLLAAIIQHTEDGG